MAAIKAKVPILGCGKARLSLSFGLQKDFWGEGKDYNHHGCDFWRDDAPAKSDTILAPWAGTMTAVQTGYKNVGNLNLVGSAQYGNMAELDVGGGHTVLCCHLETVAVKKGDKVKAGQVLGTMGRSGYCTGLHLHLGLRKGSTWIDPLPYLTGAKALPGGTLYTCCHGSCADPHQTCVEHTVEARDKHAGKTPCTAAYLQPKNRRYCNHHRSVCGQQHGEDHSAHGGAGRKVHAFALLSGHGVPMGFRAWGDCDGIR
ncbi:MAG: M23 family metallopeptidase [Oscillospiraceae bacterium]|jgi:hypothetical protein|nr:M23 family metallopeptidase [Oscillospiraceae bacterium]